MSVKRFCDICNNQIKLPEGGEVQVKTFTLGKVQCHIKLSLVDHHTEMPDICVYCFLNAINEWDDRPKPERCQ